MNHRNLINDAWVYSSNARAEDGLQPPGGWRSLCDRVLLPLGLYVALFLILLLTSQTALAQTGSGRIAGSVKDASGAVIPGSKVCLINTATGVSQNTTSSGEGVFNFLVVSIGQYQLSVTADGFNPYTQADKIKIDVNTSLTIDVTLQVAQASQTVTVTTSSASRSLISLSTAAAILTFLPFRQGSPQSRRAARAIAARGVASEPCPRLVRRIPASSPSTVNVSQTTPTT